MNKELVIRIHTGGPFGDEMSNYDIKLKKEFNFLDFTEYIVKQNPREWGEFYVYSNGAKKVIDYRYGQYWILDFETFDKIKNKKIKEVSGHGGWSLMSYNILVKG